MNWVGALAVLGGGGLFLVYGALALWPRAPQVVRAQAREQFRVAGPGAGLAYRAARSLTFNPPRFLNAPRIERLLKAANWFWGPGEGQAPDPRAPFHSVTGYLAACAYGALAYAAGGLVVGAVVAFALEWPLYPALLVAGIGALLGWTGPEAQLLGAVKRRQHRLTIEMAFRLPELAATVATGRSIIAAMRQMVERPGGPFCTELARLLRTYDLTQSMKTAVNVVVHHNQFEPLTEFLRQVLLVEQQGGAIAPALRVLAEASQETLRRRLVEQGQANKRDMGLPVVAGAMLVMLMLVAGPIVWALLNVI